MTDQPLLPEWLNGYADILLSRHAEYVATEASATQVRCFNAKVIPGIVQTSRYAEGAIASTPYRLSKRTIDRLIALRMQRQWHLHEQPRPPDVHLIIDESALYRQVCGPAALQEQLQHLEVMSEQANMTVQILPFATNTELHVTSTDFTIFAHLDTHTTVFFDNDLQGCLKNTDTAAATLYTLRYNELCQQALDTSESLRAIKDARESLYQTAVRP